MHVHYSIDVFAAFSIAYGVHAFSDKVFNHLNLRFKKKIRIYGWAAFQKRIARLRERREEKKILAKDLKKGPVVPTPLDLNNVK